MTPKIILTTLAGLLLTLASVSAKPPVILEAEDGMLGSALSTVTQSGVQAVTTTTDLAATNPGSADRVLSFSVTFPEAGVYQLYMRMYVGSEGASDDSCFYGNGFGEKDPVDDNDWILVNQLSSGIGSTDAEDYVPGTGAAGSEVWKWVMLSGYNGGESPISFTVPEGQLTQTLQVGAREDGFYIDKIAFGADGYFYTVGNLDNGESGTESTPNEPFTPTGPPIANGKWKFLGNIYAGNQLEGFTAYWNQVTPENAGKWGSVEGTRDSMNWSGLDAAYALAKDNGFPFRMHIMVWGAQQPGWINDLPASEQREEIEEWFAAVAERYPDIDYLEVVNEPLHQAPDGGDTGVVSGRANYVDALGGDGETGWDWVITSFELARQYFPNTPLVINDYGIINDALAVADYLEIIDLLIERDLLDVIAFQAHAFSTGTSAAAMEANLDALASRGLPIMITEMDVDGPTDASQLSDYQRIFPVFWDHPAVIGVTLWGFRPGLWRSNEGAYLVLANGAERPAMVWLQDYVAQSEYYNFNGYRATRGLSDEAHGFADDADGDGLETGLEYLTGADPEVANEIPYVWEVADGRVVMEFPVDPEVREGILSVKRSANLQDWETVADINLLTRRTNGLAAILGENSMTVVVDEALVAESDAQFYRICFSIDGK